MSEQVKNIPFERRCRWFQHFFSLIFNYFVFVAESSLEIADKTNLQICFKKKVQKVEKEKTNTEGNNFKLHASR